MPLLLAACSAPIDSPDETRAALIGGAHSGAALDAVVFLRANHDDGSFTDCTATLVSPHVALTAKHCVAEVQPGSFVCSGSGELVRDGTDAGLIGAVITPSRIELHSGAFPSDTAAAHARAVFATQSNDACHDDLAAVVLDQPIKVPAYVAIRWSRPTLIGESLRLSGYGMGGRKDRLERRELSNVRVADVGATSSGDDSAATTPRRTFVVDGGTVCFGDSGGPALSMETQALVGIYSRISGDCFAVESRNTYMLAESFTSIFEQAFAAASELAVQEPGLRIKDQTVTQPAPTNNPPDSATPTDAFNCAVGASSASDRDLEGVWPALAALALLLMRRRAPSAF